VAMVDVDGSRQFSADSQPKSGPRYLAKIGPVDFEVTGLTGCAFSALMLLVGRQEGHQGCKKTGRVLAWLSVWSEVQTCIWPS